jgi:hypothetical protein
MIPILETQAYLPTKAIVSSLLKTIRDPDRLKNLITQRR